MEEKIRIRQIIICGEKLSVNSEAVHLFRVKLHKLLDNKNLTGEQIFSCDKTGLNYKMLPAKILV